jgi:hypothetical protein
MSFVPLPGFGVDPRLQFCSDGVFRGCEFHAPEFGGTRRGAVSKIQCGGAGRFAIAAISMLALSIVLVFASRVPITFTF